MLLIDRESKGLIPLEKRSLPEVGLLERDDIQQMICRSPEAFFREMGEDLCLIGQEVKPSTFVGDRIDVLAADRNGALTVIEIKRGNHKLHLLQAISYAAMLSKWPPQDIVKERASFVKRSPEEVEEEIEDFLEVDVAVLNDKQRIILLAEAYDFEVLAAAEWLSENYELDIRCYRLELAADNEKEYLSCACLYPAGEISDHAKQRVTRTKSPTKWADWESALSPIPNKDIVEYFVQEIESGRPNYLKKRVLHYEVNGKRRLWISARTKRAYVWQTYRFDGDKKFWTKEIGPNIDLAPVKDGKCLRFFLETSRDFERFNDAINGPLRKVTFLPRGAIIDDGDTEEGFEESDDEEV